MNIQEELHKIFPMPNYSAMDYIKENPVNAINIAEAQARFYQHLKEVITIEQRRVKNELATRY